MSVDRATNGTVMHPAVVRLAEGTTVLRRIVADRSTLVAEALLGGAAPEQVAEAVGLDLIELRAAVGRWATRQRQDGQLTSQAYTDLLNVVFGPAGCPPLTSSQLQVTVVRWSRRVKR